MGISAAVTTFVSSITPEAVLTGAAIGAVTSAVTGGNPLEGAALGGLGGAFSSGFSGLGQAAGDSSGIASGVSGGGFSAADPFSSLFPTINSASSAGALSGGTDFAGALSPLTNQALGGSVQSSSLGATGLIPQANIGANQPTLSNAPIQKGVNTIGGNSAIPNINAANAGASNIDYISGGGGGGGSSVGLNSATGGASNGLTPATTGSNLPTTPVPTESSGATGLGGSAPTTTSGAAPTLGDSSSATGGASSATGDSTSSATGGATQQSPSDFSLDKLKTETPPTPNIVSQAGGDSAYPVTSSASPPASSSNFLSNIGSGIKNQLTKNPLQAIQLGLAGVSALTAPKSPSQVQAINQNAQLASSTGTNLINQSNAGTVTTGQQAAINLWTQQAIAQVKSYYAQQGLSGSSMEASAIANVQQQAQTQVQTIIQQNLNSGLAALGAGNTANSAVVTARQAQDNGVNQMMMNLANALGQTQGSQSKAASTSA